MPTCNECGHSTERVGKFCFRCGSEYSTLEAEVSEPTQSGPLSTDQQNTESENADSYDCPDCGTRNPVANNFCNGCGRAFGDNTHSSTSKPDTQDNARLQEVILEIHKINFSLSLLVDPQDFVSLEFRSRLEMQKIRLLETLRANIDNVLPEVTDSYLEYFYEKVREITVEQDESSHDSQLYEIAATQGMDISELGFETNFSLNKEREIPESGIENNEPSTHGLPAASEISEITSLKPSTSPIELQRRPNFDLTGLWTTLYSENAMSSFLGFGILLITISSLVLLVNYWPNEDMRLVLMGLAFVQMLAFIGVGHLVKEQIGLYFSGLALITIGAVWSLFAAGIITYLLFDPMSPEPRIPGIGLEINLIPFAWLIVSGIGTPVWGILAYKYRGYVLTHGFILLGGITIFLIVASLGQNWDIWKWGLCPIPIYGLALLYLRSFIDKSGNKTLKHPLVWSAGWIGLLPLVILVISYLTNPSQTNIPLVLCLLITAIVLLDAIRHTSVRWLEHFSALLWPFAILLIINEFDRNSEAYIALVLIAISSVYILVGNRINFSKPTSLEVTWPILKPWFAVSILLMVLIPMLEPASIWSKALSLSVATILMVVLAQNWKRQPFPWLPAIPLTFVMVYALNLIPVQISNFPSLFTEQSACPSIADITNSSRSDCLNIPLKPALMSFFGLTSLILVWSLKGRFLFSYPLVVWSITVTFISIWWAVVYSTVGSTISFVSPAILISAVIVIGSSSMIFILTLSPWFKGIWESTSVRITNYINTQLNETRACDKCDNPLKPASEPEESIDEERYCNNCGERSTSSLQHNNGVWEQKLTKAALSIGFLRTVSLFAILILIPIWVIAVLGYIFGLAQTFPGYATITWWTFTALYTIGLARYERPIWLYIGTITIHLALITLINLPSLELDTNQIGLIISISSILYLGIIGTCYKYQKWNHDYSLKTKQYIFLPLLAGAGIEAIIGLILSGWGNWGNWEGLAVTIIYTVISIVAAQISKYRFAPYVTMALFLVINVFVVGLIGGSWPTRATGWALQGLAFWWIAKGIVFISKNKLKYDLRLWVNPLENSSTRTALFAGSFAFITLAAKILGIGTFDPDLIVPTSVIAILGLLYLGKAITEKNVLSGYLAAVALLFSWYVQLIERDLSEVEIQLYAIPAGLYLLALAYLENRRKTFNPKLATASNILGVIILSGSAFVQSIISSAGIELIFVFLGGIEGMLLTIWGIFSKSKISFTAGILTFVINILYQATSLLSGTDGAIIGIVLGLFIIVLVIIIERTKSHLVSRGQKLKDYINDWDW